MTIFFVSYLFAPKISSLCSVPNAHFAAALYGLPFAERPIAIRKGYRTVKGTII